MWNRKRYGKWTAGLLFTAFVAMQSAPAYAYEYPEVPAPPQYPVHSLQKEWGGKPAGEAHAQWAGQRIQEASQNWADYGSEPVAASTPQRWAGRQIQQASMNWADYRGEPLAASNP